MKYILTEAQYSRLVESNLSHLKKLMFKYWDTHKQKFSSTFYRLFDISEWASGDQVQEFYLEWIGGIEKVYELMKNAEDNTMIARGGTYNFRFKIKDVEMGNENTEVFYNVLIDGDGDVEINVGTDYEPEIIDNIYDGITNPDIGWEVKDEVIDIIKETVREEVVDYPCELSMFEIGNRRDF
jgi:uncharacterized FAD-dependent dehydrogenase